MNTEPTVRYQAEGEVCFSSNPNAESFMTPTLATTFGAR